jgi:uncharacterized protein YcbX
MENESRILIGMISELWRYPIKTMQGEILEEATVAKKGLIGDRSFALMDKKSGRIISAKNPKKWENVFKLSAKTIVSEEDGSSIPKVSITFANGDTIFTDDKDVNEILSEKIGRSVFLTTQVPENATVEKLSLEEDEAGTIDTPSCLENLSPFGFFDGGRLHIVTTSALNRLRSVYKGGDFEARRFRPNIVIDSDDTVYGSDGSLSMEKNWEDLTLEIGDTIKLKVTKPTVRCIMTTLAQANIPKDNRILKTIDNENDGFLGVYTQTLNPGAIKTGDLVWMVGSRLIGKGQPRSASPKATPFA